MFCNVLYCINSVSLYLQLTLFVVKSVYVFQLTFIVQLDFEVQCSSANPAQAGEEAVGSADSSGLPSSFCVWSESSLTVEE